MEEVREFPQFCCIGAQKAGTSWLYVQLDRHPAFWLPPLKELNYFNAVHIEGHKKWTRNQRIKRATSDTGIALAKKPPDFATIGQWAHLASSENTDAWYRKIFEHAPLASITCDISPMYSLLDNDGIEHLLWLNSNVKVLLIVRDPIERAWSNMRMIMQRKNRGIDSLSHLVNSEELLARGQYSKIIAKWREHLSEDNFLVIPFPSVAESPMTILKTLCDFLGTEFSEEEFPLANDKVFVGGALDIPDSISDSLANFYAEEYERLDEMGIQF